MHVPWLARSLVVGAAFGSIGRAHGEPMHDVSRLETVEVREIARVETVAAMQAAVRRARAEGLKVSIAGARHSQGGHVFYPGALVLDMTGFDHVRRVDRARKLATVESGATWRQVQDAAAREGLAVRVMQASNIFTVGGSLSVNAHGRDPRFGSVVETVRAFRLLGADGEIRQVSRTENAELFDLVIGGYGLFGVILDVDLELTDDVVYEKNVRYLDAAAYPRYLQRNVLGHPEVGLHFAWPSIEVPLAMAHVLVADYVVTQERPKRVFEPHAEENVGLNRFMFGLSRDSDWGKGLRWFLQRRLIGHHEAIVSRNNAMRPEVEFLRYAGARDTDILQEYFFPLARYDAFLPELARILRAGGANLLSATLRYVPPATSPMLRYARAEPQLAAVLYLNQGLDPAAREAAATWTRALIDAVLAVGGTYYLPYQPYATKEQARRAYPMLDAFFAKKRAYDPTEMFQNQFYARYR
jgi:FAD/FMN-containing dehydrogenase